MAKITAGHLVQCLQQSGFVVMKRPEMPLRPAAKTWPSES